MSERYIDEEANEEVTTYYEWGFYRPDEAHCGFCFPVDKHGNLLCEHYSENFELCRAGKMPNVRDCGIKKSVVRRRLCNCGSLKHYQDVHDARGLFVARVCDDCREDRLKGYRPEIFEDRNYDTYGDYVEEDY